VAFACVVGFMGIGLVDPILPSIARGLRASPSQVELLFTSYFAVTAVMMLVTGFVSTRIGSRPTLLVGLAVIVIFASLSGSSGSVGELVGMRAGWGFGNALFIATALAVIVGSASGGIPGAIILYESALGLGISMGPLVGGVLGGISWRGPFFGTATLMAIGFVLVLTMLGPVPRPHRRTSLLDPLRAVRDPGLRTIAVMALFYNFGFFTILAYTPFVIDQSVHVLGLIYFGWGLLLALSSVLLAPRLERRFGTVIPLFGVLTCLTLLLAVMALAPRLGVIAAVVVSGAVLGVNNTLVTQAAMTVSSAERPVASAGYNFVRWIGGSLAPFLAGQLAVHVGPRAPFVMGAGAVVLGAVVLGTGLAHLGALPGRARAGAAAAS
jgi:MFS family permease